MRFCTLLLFVLALAACGSAPVATPADATHLADAADAPTDRCGGLCGAGTVCIEGRCVASDAGVDVPVDVLLPADAMDVAEDRGSDAPMDTGCPANADRLPSGGCACVLGYRLCGDACRELDTDPANCGACGNVCSGGVCAGGRCATVDAGVDVPADDGAMCVSMTPGNCCGIACPTHPTGTPTCSSGRCGIMCVSIAGAFVNGDCDGNAANGCEVDLRTDNGNCGACGAACASRRRCVNRACVCPVGFGDCDGDPSNGCETDVTISTLHCGRCGNRCTGGCRNGTCA